MDWNVEKGEQRKNLLSSSRYEEFFAFLEMKTSQMDTENDKNPKGFQFSKVLGISSSLTDSVDWNVEKGQQGKHLLSSSLYEEFIAFLERKYFKLTPKFTKIPKVSNFKDFLQFFRRFSTDFVGWNVEKGQQKTNVLSSRLFLSVS